MRNTLAESQTLLHGRLLGGNLAPRSHVWVPDANLSWGKGWKTALTALQKGSAEKAGNRIAQETPPRPSGAGFRRNSVLGQRPEKGLSTYNRATS